MGREVRMVPATWTHPKDGRGRYIPMHDTGYTDALREWETETLPEWIEGARLWSVGLVRKYGGGTKTIEQAVADARANHRTAPDYPTYEWWAGDVPRKPNPADYMPDWPEAERTHFMMYEDTSEGTPISPAFATAEELARWLADTGASAFAGDTATYEQWLAMIYRGSTIASALIVDGQWVSGVAAVQLDAARRS